MYFCMGEPERHFLIMRRLYLFLFAAVLVCACQKNPVEAVSGNYSFKTGGVLETNGETISLVPESGQMKILPDGGDKVVITMNVTGGGAFVFNGTLSGSKITLSQIEREVLMLDGFGILELPAGALLRVGGEGTVYGNTLVFTMDYSGSFKSGNVVCNILSSNVNCIATRNE